MYIVIEIQENGGVVGTIVQSYETLASAESAWHGILASAALSTVENHSAVLLSDEGFPLRHECYKHNGTQAMPEEQTEPNVIEG